MPAREIPPRTRRSPSPGSLLAVAGALACTAALVGCAGDDGYRGVRTSLSGSIGHPFDGPTEKGFVAMVMHSCAALPVGDATVGALLDTDERFQALTTELYHGDISNDEYINRILLLHPAPDANIPATGCIINQLQTCLASPCKVGADADLPSTAEDIPAVDPDVFEPQPGASAPEPLPSEPPLTRGRRDADTLETPGMTATPTPLP